MSALDLAVLTALRLKGRADVTVVSTCAGTDAGSAQSALDTLLDRELAAGGPAYRLTPAGREALVALLDAERPGIDHAALEAAYHDFDEVNTALKTAVTNWQLIGGTTPNDHTDAAYDAAVIAQIVAVDEAFTPLLERILTIVSRLAPYRSRFATAITKLGEGDHTYVARPTIDSYHQVWFEFHEELIALLGRTRADEAAAGRAV
ncbi:MAG: hypothetical protein ACT4PP_01320 [Sporichthyaceae bacterium]